MKTLQQQETDAILSLAEAHEKQRIVIFQLSQKLDQANAMINALRDRVKELEARNERTN